MKKISFSSDHLIDQIVQGRKTASAEWVDQQGDLSEWDNQLTVGDYYTVCDSERKPRCIIRITQITLCRWNAIPEWLWRGETNDCAEEFRTDHVECFKHPSDDFEFIGFAFHLVDELTAN